MNTIEKIIKLIQEDKQIGSLLFQFSEIRKDVKLWTGEDEDNFDYTDIKWLFITNHPNLTLVGLNTLDNTIWCIDDEGDFHQDCNSLQDLPYEILRGDCSYTDNETVAEYFEKYKEEGYKETLVRYEQWCAENNIELDKQRIYHDEHGKLFTHYFNDKSTINYGYPLLKT